MTLEELKTEAAAFVTKIETYVGEAEKTAKADASKVAAKAKELLAEIKKVL